MYFILSYIRYWLLQSDEHSIHAPFLFKFYTEVIKKQHSDNKEIESLRERLKQDETEFEIVDFGAGSKTNSNAKRSVKSIANHVATPVKFSAFLAALIDYLDYTELVELGTSLGLNTLYMSQNNDCKVTTFEGDPSLCKLAKQNFQELSRTNIEVTEGNIDLTLPRYLKTIQQIDLIYIDANHRYEPTLEYFELCLPKMSKNGLMIFDDIHWSNGMWKAWNEIKKRPESILCIDIFEAGLVFLNPDLQKGDYTLKF